MYDGSYVLRGVAEDSEFSSLFAHLGIYNMAAERFGIGTW